MNDNRKIAISQDLAFEILEILRLNPIYVLMNSKFQDDLPEDFKPHKWEGYEKEFADESYKAYKTLFAYMERQVKPPATKSKASELH